MAITFTIAGLQTELQTAATAIDSEDFAAARKAIVKANLVLGGLPLSADVDGSLVKMRESLAQLEAQVDAAEASVSATDRRRLIRVGLTHRSRGREF